MTIDFKQLPSWKHWNKIGVKPRHGINLPLASLKTAQSSGIGEFADLLPLIDWCQDVGFEVIQLLPLNDSGTDPSPYNALSSCALHPIYLSLQHLPGNPTPPDASHLNTLPRVSYLEVLSLKLNFLHTYCNEKGSDLIKSKEFQHFVDQNAWLVPYALFKVLKDKLQHTPWMSWPEELKTPDFKRLEAEHTQDLAFYLLLQFLCHIQMAHVKEYAHSKGILLKGDIPILISPDSVDAWFKPHRFNFTLSAGAPPDAYDSEGQYWGFPLFNWEDLKNEDFLWWKDRLKVASNYYDLYRIDHVVGFFRIWAIPLGHPPKEGKFLPENPALWVPQGKEILLMMLNASSMLPIAEDLGTVPPSVRTTLEELGICGTKVIRWQRKYDEGGAFIPFNEYPSLSMTTVSTHDSETLQLWWLDPIEDAKQFCTFKGWTFSPDLSYDHRLSILRDAHHTPSLFHINLLPEYLALFPELISSHPDDERINIPGKILPTNWTYRLHLPLEEIARHEPLKKAIKAILLSP
ncbi:MAG TPA: 4-alpha-glucanotransferase [Rhabdochlamydiaceae bacterium]|nr:4-alpha-glucanotransferase [Rhabdochlamydiaceae bacterium]